MGGYDVTYADDTELNVEQSQGVFLGLMLSGRSTSIRLEGLGEFEIPVGRPIIVTFGESILCSNCYKAGEHCAGIGITLPLRFFETHEDSDLSADLYPLRDLLNRSTDVEVLPACQEMARLAAQLLSVANKDTAAKLLLEGLGQVLLAQFCKKLVEARQNPNKVGLNDAEWERVKRVTDYLEENLDRTPSLNQLSRLAGTNQTTLSDQFKAVHHETIFSYLRNRRLEVARDLLRTENTSVTDISFRVGFSSSTSFATAFRRRYGYPPSQEASDF